MLTTETLERVEEILGELKEHAEAGVPIVVEGARDRESLLAMGVKGKISQISSGKRTALNFLENLAGHSRIVILTDFDRAGEELARFCAKHLRNLGVEPIVEPRDKLKKLLHKDIKDIEGLSKFMTKRGAGSRKVPGGHGFV